MYPDARQHGRAADDGGPQTLPGGDEELAYGFRLRRERSQHQHRVDQRDGRVSLIRDQLANRLDLRTRGGRG